MINWIRSWNWYGILGVWKWWWCMGLISIPFAVLKILIDEKYFGYDSNISMMIFIVAVIIANFAIQGLPPDGINAPLEKKVVKNIK